MSKNSEPPELHLEFTEEFFGALWKRWRNKGGCPHPDAAAKLEEIETALSTVAQAFAESHLSVHLAEASGGVHKKIVLLPRWIALCEDREANRDFFFVRAAIAGAMVKDFEKFETSSESDFLAAAIRLIQNLAKDHQGFADRIKRAAKLELSIRPQPELLHRNQVELERMRQAALHAVVESIAEVSPSALAVSTTLPQSTPATAPATIAARAPIKQPSRKSKKGGASAPILLFGGPLKPSEIEAADELSNKKEEEAGVAAGANEVKAPPKDHVKRILFKEDPYKANMPEHAFEKVMFAEESDGGQRRLDGEDDMDEQQDSLDAVDLRELIRGGPEVHSVYKADIGNPGEIPDVTSTLPGEKGIPYDEWDEKKRAYRSDWVTVFPTPIDHSDPTAGLELSRKLAPVVRKALRQLQRRRTERLTLNRQLDGDTIDMAALVNDHALLRAGESPSGRVYIHKPRLERDLATSVLLDISLSADSWIDNRRVLDVEKEAACVLGEVAEEMGDALQILAYASHTRNHCRMWEVKDWDDPWPKGRARLSTLKPQGYTRIGPSIRHATAELKKHPARRKHLILITDAKPTDFDRYEGAYGVHDVRQAVREARQSGIGVHALGIDPKSAGILPIMFGVRGWKLLRTLADLPEALVAAYSELG